MKIVVVWVVAPFNLQKFTDVSEVLGMSHRPDDRGSKHI
jgi:hypothetical protein